MRAMRARSEAHRPSEEGATMVEYGMLLGLIALVVVVAVVVLGERVAVLYEPAAALLP